MSTNLTLVSAFLELAKMSYSAEQAFIQNFEMLASTEIPMCLYISCGAVAKISHILTKYPTVKVMEIVSLQSTQCAFDAAHCTGLPANRSVAKDTREYILLMNSKTEFMRKAISANPFNSTHFAWADFRLAHVFSQPKSSIAYLRELARATLSPKFLAIPGCRAKISASQHQDKGVFGDNILWRFCGGFFIGDKSSVLHFANMHAEFFPKFIQTFGVIAWEVNIWAWLETHSLALGTAIWNPDWFAADHNDSIISIPTKFFAARMVLYATRMIDYAFPLLAPGFVAGSMSVIVGADKRRIANVRHVNYTLCDSGAYIFSDPDGILATRNVYYELGADWLPIRNAEMQPPSANELTRQPSKFLGLEDMRLFMRTDNQIGCISSSVEHSSTFESRMVRGLYNVAELKICDCEVLGPPLDVGGWQKNWAPLPGGLFVYGWNPFTVGMIIDGVLSIEYTYEIVSPIFTHARGSTPFVARKTKPEELIGVIHFSESNSPRQYFHMLVVLDAHTFEPLWRSEVFVFESIGIEFCIGMLEDEDVYRFWISRFDRDPAMFEVPVKCVPVNIQIAR